MKGLFIAALTIIAVVIAVCILHICSLVYVR